MQPNHKDSSGGELWSNTCTEHAAPSSTSTAASGHGLLHSHTDPIEGVSISSLPNSPVMWLNPLQGNTTPHRTISVSNSTLHESQVDSTPGTDAYTVPSFCNSSPDHSSSFILQFELPHDSKHRISLPASRTISGCQPCGVGDLPPAAALTGSSPPTACYPASPRILDILTHHDRAPQQGCLSC